jgi:hypothetical protein
LAARQAEFSGDRFLRARCEVARFENRSLPAQGARAMWKSHLLGSEIFSQAFQFAADAPKREAIRQHVRLRRKESRNKTIVSQGVGVVQVAK